MLDLRQSEEKKKTFLNFNIQPMEQTETKKEGKEEICTLPVITRKTSTLPSLHPHAQENHLCTHGEKDHPGSKWLT